MKRPTILGGIAFAFVVAVLAVPGWWTLKAIFPFDLAFRSMVTLSYLSYVAYVLWTSGRQTGIVTLALANIAFAVLISLLPVTIPTTVILFVILVSLNRSMVRHRSLVSVAADGSISAVGFLFGSYLYYRSGSLVGSLWGFLLLQSLWVAVPEWISLLTGWSQTASSESPIDSFVHSQRQAEAAIQRMTDYHGL